jgi:hypothetical protein
MEEHRADVGGDAGAVIGTISAQPHCRLAPHTAAAARPPGHSSRRISHSARTGSGTYISPSAHTAASKPASGSGSASASARSKRALASSRSAAPRCAVSTISPEMSVPTTVPSRPTVTAARKLIRPVPQATSSRRSPGRNAAMPSIRECAGSSWSRQLASYATTARSQP